MPYIVTLALVDNVFTSFALSKNIAHFLVVFFIHCDTLTYNRDQLWLKRAGALSRYAFVHVGYFEALKIAKSCQD